MTQTPTPQLPERYQLAEVVGTGATSRVYRAIDTVLDAPRAVKILKTGNDPNFAERLLREARAMARVAHPNILQVYDAGMLRDGRAWVVTDLAHGSLAGRIASDGPLPVERAIALADQVLTALQAAHDAGIVHRDVKPENVLLSAHDSALLADFGIAAVLSDELRHTDHNITLGTFAYMAPEQRIDARGVGPAADQYAAAATFYQAITAASPVDLFAARPDSERWQGVPAALRDVLRRALSYDAADRFETCRAFAEALRDLTDGRQRLHSSVSIELHEPAFRVDPRANPQSVPPGLEPTPVNITATIEQLYHRSLHERLQGILDARNDALNGDETARQTLTRIAHALRGSGATYGFPIITERAGALEDALRRGEDSVSGPITDLIHAIRGILTQTAGDKQRVLVAVGDPVVSGVLQVALQRANRHVIAVDTVAAAREAVRERPAAAAVIDLVLPDADGRVLLDDPRLRQVPSVVIAGGVSEGLRAELVARGAAAVFAKPVDPVSVASAVATLLSRAGAETSQVHSATGLPNHIALRDALTLANSSFHPSRAFSVVHILPPTDADLHQWASAVAEAAPSNTLVAHIDANELAAVIYEDARTAEAITLSAIERVCDAQGCQELAAVGIAEGGGSSVADLLVSASRMAQHARSVGEPSAIAARTVTAAGRVLLVEDDPATAAMVVRLLSEDGLEVTRASQGDEARSILLSQDFDLMLLDVYVPGVDGFELLETARSSTRHHGTPAVMLTAVGDERQVARAFELGADDYVVKPFRRIELKARVRRLLRKPVR